MKKITFVVACLVVIFNANITFAQDTDSEAAEAAAERVMDGIRMQCAEKWPDDYSMRNFCVEKETDGLINVSEYGIGDDISVRCLLKWSNGDVESDDFFSSVSWSMVDYCIEKENEAKSSGKW